MTGRARREARQTGSSINFCAGTGGKKLSPITFQILIICCVLPRLKTMTLRANQGNNVVRTNIHSSSQTNFCMANTCS